MLHVFLLLLQEVIADGIQCIGSEFIIPQQNLSGEGKQEKKKEPICDSQWPRTRRFGFQPLLGLRFLYKNGRSVTNLAPPFCFFT